jgi:hypothetical protein
VFVDDIPYRADNQSIRFVMEISKMQNRPDNMPLLDTEGESDSEEKPPPKEPRKDR